MTTTSATGSTSSTTASATQSILKALSAGSGIDTASLADQLVAAQFANQEDALTAKGTKLTAEISAVSMLKADITSFSSSLQTLIKGGTLQSQPTVSTSGIVNDTGIAGAKLAGLSASLEVKQLAAAQSAATGVIADPTANLGGGTLTLTLGAATVAGGQMTAFTAGSAAPVDITIDPTHSSLKDIAAAINAADAGVTATIVSDADGARLMLKGATGADQAFTLTAAEDPAAPGLAALNVGVGATGTTIGAAAQDALVALDGVTLKRSSNSFSDLIAGVQIDLVSAKPGEVVSIGSARPTAALSQSVGDFVDTYNQMIAEVNTDTDAQTGALAQDDAARNMKRMLAKLTLTPLIAPNGDAPTTLAEIGVGTNKDGTLTLDQEQLSKALTRWPDQVEAMFADVTGTITSAGGTNVTSGRGLLGALGSISAAAASSTFGLSASLAKYQKAQSDLSDQSDALKTKEDAMHARLVQQFASMDAKVSSYKSTQTFLQQQIDAWNGKNDN
jgi:flagellar hook-associated protein 2